MISFDSTADVTYGPTMDLNLSDMSIFKAANTLSAAGTGYWNALNRVTEMLNGDLKNNGNENHVVFLSDGCPTMTPTGSWYQSLGPVGRWIFSKVIGFVVGGWVEVRYDPPSNYYTRDWLAGILQAIGGGIASLVNAEEPSVWVSHSDGGIPKSLWGNILDECNKIKDQGTLYTISFCSDGAESGLGAMSSNGIAYSANDKEELSDVITAICNNFATDEVDDKYTSNNGLITLPDNNVAINIIYAGEMDTIPEEIAKEIINGLTLDLNKLYSYLKEQGKMVGINEIQIKKL